MISIWRLQCNDNDDEPLFFTTKQKAEEYLVYFSEQNPERKRKQAYIYSKTNRENEAYKAYEELVFSKIVTESSFLDIAEFKKRIIEIEQAYEEANQ